MYMEFIMKLEANEIKNMLKDLETVGFKKGEPEILHNLPMLGRLWLYLDSASRKEK